MMFSLSLPRDRNFRLLFGTDDDSIYVRSTANKESAVTPSNLDAESTTSRVDSPGKAWKIRAWSSRRRPGNWRRTGPDLGQINFKDATVKPRITQKS